MQWTRSGPPHLLCSCGKLHRPSSLEASPSPMASTDLSDPKRQRSVSRKERCSTRRGCAEAHVLHRCFAVLATVGYFFPRYGTHERNRGSVMSKQSAPSELSEQEVLAWRMLSRRTKRVRRKQAYKKKRSHVNGDEERKKLPRKLPKHVCTRILPIENVF